MNWVMFVIIASALSGFCNIIDQILRKKHIKDSIVLSIYFGFSGLLLLLIPLFKEIAIPPLFNILILLVVGIFWIFGATLYVYSISVEEVSRVIPLWEISPIFVLLMAFLFLGERLTSSQLLAFFLILAGCFLISLKNVRGLFKLSRAFFPMILSGFMFAVTNILIKFMYSKMDFWTTLVWLGLGQVIASLLILLFKKHRTNFIKSIKSLKPKIAGALVANESIAVIARIFYNYALLLGPVSLVYVLSGTSSFFVLLYAILFSVFLPKLVKEDIGKKVLLTKIIAIILIFIGLYFLYV